MSKFKIMFNQDYQPSPMTFWVHHDINSEVWLYASKYEPVLPSAIFSKGFPMLIVDALGHELMFSSIQEIEHFLEVVNKKNMPTSTSLARKRPMSTGLNNHWLSRLPSKLKSWRNRQKYIPIIEEGLMNFTKLYN